MTVCKAGWSVVGTVLISLSMARDAAAQISPQLPETRALLLGPASIYPTIALRDAGTDSNVYNDSTSPKSDLTYSVTPKLFAVVPIANTRFIGTGAGDLVYYRTYADQRSLTTQFEGRYEVTSPGFRPFASAWFVSHGGREGFEIDARAQRTQRIVTAGLDADVTPVTALTAWVSRSITSFDPREEYLSVSLAEQLNHSSDVIAAGTRVHLTPLTTVLFAAEYERDRFERSPVRDADSLRIAPQVAFDSGAAISGDVKAGFRAFSPHDPALAGYKGFTGSARLHYTLLTLTRFDVEWNRDVTFSFDVTQPYYLESGGRLMVTHRIIGPLEVVGIGERRDLRNQRIGGRSFDGRREVTTSAGGGFAIRLQQQTRIGLTYERTERTSTEPIGRNYERRRVLASFTYGLSL